MIDILGIKYITEKEASTRYGYSMAWFSKQRYKNLAPRYTRLTNSNKGRVLYPIEQTDAWFKMQIERNNR